MAGGSALFVPLPAAGRWTQRRAKLDHYLSQSGWDVHVLTSVGTTEQPLDAS
jgi:hypothetical protein